MTTEITSHRGGILNDNLRIKANGDPGANGACVQYLITSPYISWPMLILFQNGPIEIDTSTGGINGINGISNEALLAIVAHRLEGFQSGPFECESNRMAKAHVEMALEHLKIRTAERQARNVEGTHEP